MILALINSTSASKLLSTYIDNYTAEYIYVHIYALLRTKTTFIICTVTIYVIRISYVCVYIAIVRITPCVAMY